MTPPLPGGDFEVRLTDEQVEAFRRDGFVSIPRITTDEEVAWIGNVFDDLFATRRAGVPGGYFDLARPYDAPGEDDLPQVLFPEQVVPDLRHTIFRRNGRAIAAQLIGVDLDDLRAWGHMIYKPPRHGHEIPWHQDEAYWEPHLDYRAVGAWMPLDDADLGNGCMCFLPGSHRFDVLPHRHMDDDPAVHGLQTDVDDTTAMVAVPLPAGGASFHHPRTLHHTPPNASERPRRAFASEFQTTPTPRVVPAERPWVDEGKAAWARRTRP